ncbi:ATP-binding protein [Intrasporangium flavum]|uniref:ATP-binding protein n=1 Tax=Intrasporangium flavum TaxID=1428657 RepID=UPI001A95B91F|nr:ATP-binding protein [Intrasporangium flavum]
MTTFLSSRRAWGATALAVLLGVVVLGATAVKFAPPGSSVAVWWPAAGLAVAFLLVSGPDRRRAAVFVAGVLVASGLANYYGGRPPLVAAAFGVANALEAFVVHRLMTRGGRRPRLASMDDLFRLLAAALAGALTFGVLAGLVVTVGLHSTFFPTAYAVTASHAAAVLVIGPLGIAVVTPRVRAFGLEDVAQMVLVVGVTLWVFRQGQGLPLAFLPLPTLAWAATRQGLRAVAAQLITVGVLAVYGTSTGGGPFAFAGTRADVRPETVGALTQAFLVTAAITTLSLAVASTQRRRAIAELRTEGQFTAVVLDTAATAIVVVDTEGRIGRLNRTAASWIGRHEDELVGLEAAQTFPIAEGRDALVRRFAGLRDHDFPETDEQEWVTPEGRRRNIVWSNRWLTDELGRRSHLVKTGVDVTESRAALERERRVVEELTALDQTKNDFVSSVSHELRTPLASVLGYTEMLEDGAAGELTSRQGELVARIDRNGRRLLELIEDLLVNSRIESGQLDLDLRRCDLADVVAHAWDGLRPLSERRDLDLSIDVDRKPVWVRGDPAALERVTMNLLSNAVKFTPDGGSVEVSLEVGNGHAAPARTASDGVDGSAAPDGRCARLVVRDSGIGIPSADLEKVFRRFYRSKTATDQAIQGTGLGLSIVRAIVEGHGGTIEVVSAPGAGATFTVTLPALPVGAAS